MWYFLSQNESKEAELIKRANRKGHAKVINDPLIFSFEDFIDINLFVLNKTTKMTKTDKNVRECLNSHSVQQEKGLYKT